MPLAGMAAGANQELQEMLARAFAEQQAQQVLAQRQAELEQRAQSQATDAQMRMAEMAQRSTAFNADEAHRRGQTERQARLDDVAATDRRQEENQRGVRRMIGDFLVQRGSTPLDAGARQTLQGMAVQEDVALPSSVTTDPSVANTEWERRQGIEHKNRLAEIAAQGTQTRQTAAARSSNAPDPEDAAAVTRTALNLVDRLEKHGGMGAATGAYELRGFTQPAVDFNSIRDQLVAALALPNLGALRGPMSDKDVLFVKQLATRLSNPRISEAETRTALAEAKTFLGSKMGPTSILPPAGDLVWDPVSKTLKPAQVQP